MLLLLHRVSSFGGSPLVGVAEYVLRGEVLNQQVNLTLDWHYKLTK